MIDHIYVEEEALLYKRTGLILRKFKNAKVVTIERANTFFARANQSYSEQKDHPALVLAVGRSPFINPGSGNCEDFGNKNFYYATISKNCLFSCDYCYLQGMYRSGNVVIYVNIEDCLREAEELVKQNAGLGGTYICLSYDTDLVSLEGITGYCAAWNEFARQMTEKFGEGAFKAEIRTKSGETGLFDSLIPSDNVIFAWTLSPEEIIKRHEKRTAKAMNRIKAAKYAQERGFMTRLCFDPVLFDEGVNVKEEYKKLAEEIYELGIANKLEAVSIGGFRLPADYLKRMRKNAPYSTLSWYPYDVNDGTAKYPKEKESEILNAIEKMMKDIGVKTVYIWD